MGTNKLRLVSEASSTPHEVTALIVEWIEAKKESDGWSNERVGKHLGVSRVQISNVLTGSRGVGGKLETNFAAKEYGGSVDALRRAATQHSAERAKRQPRAGELPDDLAAALDLMRSRAPIPDEVVEALAEIARKGPGFTFRTWISGIEDLIAAHAKARAREPMSAEPRSPQVVRR